ncbi:MAG: hypothetical protein N2V78_11515 [Methanophagales archaeon]|nr:hypothetical protein [Methanophagales archaeon]
MKHIIALSVFLSFAFAMLLTPITIKILRRRGILAVDYYKRERREVPKSGGIAVISASLLSFSVLMFNTYLHNPCNLHDHNIDFVAILLMLFYGIFGAIDDFTDIGRPIKIFFPLILSLPALITAHSTEIFLPFIGFFDFSYLFYVIIIVYIMVVSNLVNMHSGFNGLASGLSAILISTLLVKIAMKGGDFIFLGCVLGAILGFLWYNWYPARVFLGNVGSLSVGAVIGYAIVAFGFFISGFIMLIPHTANFILYVYWRLMHKMRPEDERFKMVKFGRVREDGTIEVPNRLTLKWILPYYFKMTEKEAVLAMYALTASFCLISLCIPF